MFLIYCVSLFRLTFAHRLGHYFMNTLTFYYTIVRKSREIDTQNGQWYTIGKFELELVASIHFMCHGFLVGVPFGKMEVCHASPNAALIGSFCRVHLP